MNPLTEAVSTVSTVSDILKSGFDLVTQGITYVMSQPVLMIPIGLSIGAYVIRVVKSNVRA